MSLPYEDVSTIVLRVLIYVGIVFRRFVSVHDNIQINYISRMDFT
jgi:hypothetical protein